MNDTPKTNGGIGGVLTTLASSGDNWVKLLIVCGIILNTFWTKSNNKGISNNSIELDVLRKQMARQIRVIHGNQKTYIEGINEARVNHVAIMEKLGIPHPLFTPYPQSTPPDFLDPDFEP